MAKISIRRAKLNELPRVTFITKLAYKIPYKENTLITKSHEPKDVNEQFSKNNFFIIHDIHMSKKI
jgi:hypothetical protein